MTKKILFVVNVDWFFISHRLPLALEALKKGETDVTKFLLHDIEKAVPDTSLNELLPSAVRSKYPIATTEF